jgi:hypothetical protein
MKERFLFIWPNSSTHTILSNDAEKLQALVEENVKRDDSWTFIWSPDVPQPKSEEFADDPEKFKSLVKLVKQMRKY